jgi:transposase, IS5 family
LLIIRGAHNFVWADSGYAGAQFEDLLDMAGFESRIHEKGSRCHPLSEEAQERNKACPAMPW